MREYVGLLLAESKRAEMSAQNQGDIDKAIEWGNLNKIITNVGVARHDNGRHSVNVAFKGTKADFVSFIKARFGSFIDVR